MKTNWGKRIAILSSAIGLLVLAGFVLFTPQRTFAEEETCPDGSPLEFGCAGEPTPGGGQSSGDLATPAKGTGNAEGMNCDSFVGGGFMCTVSKFFYYTVYVLFGTLLTLAAAFLDVIINVTIIEFSNWIKTVSGVRVAWTILRDVMNITFIFMLLYASISMILGLGKEKGIVKGVVLAGLLINFSFFFTSVIIDVSNVPTVEMFKTIQRIGERAGGVTTPGTFSTADGITNVFMQGLGIQTQSPKGLSPNGEEVDTHIFQQLIFSSIAILIIAFVFFAMALLLLGRFIVLIILLITSPISVMGGLLPQLSKHSQTWWKTLIDQAVFAPIMMLFMLVTVLIVTDPSFKAGLNIGDSAVNVPFAGGIAGMINYAIVIGLLLTGIVIAKKSAGAASNGAADWAIKKAQSIPSTAGRWAGVAAGGISGAAGRNTVGTFSRWSGGKYDLAMGKLAQSDSKWKRGVAATTRGLGIDEGVRDTFKGAASLKFGSQANLAEREKQVAQRTKELGQAVKDDKTAQTIAAGMAISNELKSQKKYSTDHTIKDKNGNDIKPIEDFIKEVGKLTNNQIEEMLQSGDKRLTDQTFASALTAKHMEKILESALISDKQKADIGDAREKGMLARIDPKVAANVAAEAARFASGKPADVAQLPSKVLVEPEVASRLSIGALSKIASDGKVSESDKTAIKKGIDTKLAELNQITNWTSDQLDHAEGARKLRDWLDSDAGKIF